MKALLLTHCSLHERAAVIAGELLAGDVGHMVEANVAGVAQGIVDVVHLDPERVPLIQEH